jgi:hypothetical protein
MLARTMGVTTAIVLAIFAGIFWPHAIRNRQQFYFAIGAVLLIIVFETLDGMILNPGFHRFASLMVGIGQIVGILGIILAASGQSVGEFAADTVEVVRRGEEEKEILIKGTGTRRANERDVVDDAGRIDLGSTDALAGKPPLRANVPPPPPGGPIPLDE